MSYFTQDYNEFLKELAANNDRDWFKARKKRYEASVKEPFKAFVADLIEAIGEHEPETKKLLPKTAIYRIYRDTRFSKDKTPYKLYNSAVVSPYGRKSMDYPGLYFQFGAGELWIGGGSYMPPKEELHNIRQSMSEQPDRVRKLLSDSVFVKRFGEIRGDKNKRIPKEFKEAHQDLPLIANKQFYFMAEYDDESIILREDLIDFVVQHYLDAKAWIDFLRECWKGGAQKR